MCTQVAQYSVCRILDQAENKENLKTTLITATTSVIFTLIEKIKVSYKPAGLAFI